MTYLNDFSLFLFVLFCFALSSFSYFISLHMSTLYVYLLFFFAVLCCPSMALYYCSHLTPSRSSILHLHINFLRSDANT